MLKGDEPIPGAPTHVEDGRETASGATLNSGSTRFRDKRKKDGGAATSATSGANGIETKDMGDAAADASAAPPPPQLNTNTSIKKFSCLRSFHLGPLMSAAVVECIGTFLLVLTVPLSSKENGEMAPIAIGFILMSLVFSFGYLSGGHLNPMVTVSVWLCTASGEGYAVFNKRRLILYLIAQMAGGTLAGFFAMMIEGRDFPVPNMGDDFVRMLRGFLAESVFTFVLCSVVLHVAISKQRNNNFYGFAIGFAVLCGGLTCGPVSGGAFNPAVATPLIVIRCFFSFTKDACLPMGSLWVYWASEVVGAVVASIMYLALMNVEEHF